MQLRLFPKLVLFALFIYAATGTYRYLILMNAIPAPKPVQAVVTWTPADQKVVGVVRDGDFNIAAWNAQSGLMGYSTGEDHLLAPKSAPVTFPYSVAVAWLVVAVILLMTFLRIPNQEEGQVYGILNGEEVSQ